jgi:hypothetical protein
MLVPVGFERNCAEKILINPSYPSDATLTGSEMVQDVRRARLRVY